MANWLDKALGRKSSTAAVAVVPFDVRCECGSRLTGVRSDRARRSICAQCGEAYFILPVNQYPESKRTYFNDEAPGRTVEDSKEIASDHATEERVAPADVYVTDAEDPELTGPDVDLGLEFELDDVVESRPEEPPADDDSDDLLDFLDKPPEPEGRSRKRRGSLYETPQREQQRPPANEAPLKEARERKRASRKNSGESPSRSVPSGMIEVRRTDGGWGETRTRLVLVIAGVIALALGMATWAIRRQAVDHAETRLTVAQDAGLDAFDAGDFVEARQQLRIALDALDVIGADEEQIAPVRQRWLEAEFATHLLDGSLIDVVDATRDAEGLEREDWLRQFDVSFADRWLLIDLNPLEVVKGEIRNQEGDVQGSETRLLYPWTVEEKPIHIAGVESLLDVGRQRIVLAGRLRSSSFDSDAQAWVVRLDGDDSFLWTDFSALVKLGFVADEEDYQELKQILQDQQRAANRETSVSDNGSAEQPVNAGGEEGES